MILDSLWGNCYLIRYLQIKEIYTPKGNYRRKMPLFTISKPGRSLFPTIIEMFQISQVFQERQVLQ